VIYICALVGWNKNNSWTLSLILRESFLISGLYEFGYTPDHSVVEKILKNVPLPHNAGTPCLFYCQYGSAGQRGCWHNCRVRWFTRRQNTWKTIGENLSFVLFVCPERREYIQRTIFKLWNHAWNYDTLPSATQDVSSRKGTTNWSRSFYTRMFVAWRTGTRLITLGCNSRRFPHRVCRSNSTDRCIQSHVFNIRYHSLRVSEIYYYFSHDLNVRVFTVHKYLCYCRYLICSTSGLSKQHLFRCFLCVCCVISKSSFIAQPAVLWL